MKHTILLLFICISAVTFGQERACEKFKNGKFKITDPIAGESIIERIGSKQIESSELSQSILEFKVKWLDECTYTLKLKKIHANPSHFPFTKRMIVTVEIIETKENSYIQRATSSKSDVVFTGEMFNID